jgi:methionyl-tRNA formyltransferase
LNYPTAARGVYLIENIKRNHSIMKFAIAANDRNIGVLESFIDRGWQPLKLFASPADTLSNSNDDIFARAEELGIPIQLSRMTSGDLAALGAIGCDVMVCAGYNWLIPDWRPHLPYGVNFHPSPLPHGRGHDPLVRAVLDNWGAWAMTCQQLSATFDRGDILASENFVLADEECYDSLDLKLQIAGRRLAFRVAANFTDLWAGAQPQGAGSYWKRWSREDREVQFSRRVSEVLRHIRAFGPFESTTTIEGAPILVRRAVGWREPHAYEPGALIHANRDRLVVAATDGFVGLTEWRAEPGAAPNRRPTVALVTA